MASKDTLRQWFTPRELRLFFGARSKSELAQVASLMRGMTDEQRQKFKRVLAQTGGLMYQEREIKR